jgi:hypothetical protein
MCAMIIHLCELTGILGSGRIIVGDSVFPTVELRRLLAIIIFTAFLPRVSFSPVYKLKVFEWTFRYGSLIIIIVI